MEQTLDTKTFAAMQTGKPFKTYKKTILGRVSIKYLSPFNGKPEEGILYGSNTDETAFIDLWTEMEDIYFKRMNKRHLDLGYLLPVEKVEKVEEKTIEQYSDEELRGVINMHYAKLQKIISEIKTEAVLLRMISLAQEMEKSDKIITALQAKLSEVQRA